MMLKLPSTFKNKKCCHKFHSVVKKNTRRLLSNSLTFLTKTQTSNSERNGGVGVLAKECSRHPAAKNNNFRIVQLPVLS